MHDDVVAQQADLALAIDEAVLDVATRNRTDLGDTEYFADLYASLVDFLEHRIEQARHRALNLIRQLVDDGVQSNVDLFLLGRRLRGTLGTNVEADDDRLRRRRQQHVGLGDRADTGVNHANTNLVVGQLLQRVGQDFGGTADVRLDHDVEILDLAFLEMIVQLVERNAISLRHRKLTSLVFTIQNDLLGLSRIGHSLQRIADFRQ